MSWRQSLPLVAIGGVLGSTGRWALLGLVAPPHFPWPTLVANLVGCGLLGVLVGRKVQTSILLLAGVGICGGLTTFSTLAVEVANLLQGGDSGVGLAYLSASLLGGAATFRCGWFAGTGRS